MRAAFLKVAPIVFLGVLPVVVLAFALRALVGNENAGLDFRYELYPEAKLVLHGHNPFPGPHADLSSGLNRIFPIPAAILAAPFTAFRAGVAAGLFCLVLALLLMLTLWVLDVRDWRVYGLVVLWPGAIAAVQTGNITIVLTLLVALAWRTRGRAWAPGLAVGAAIALKLYLWPLLVWLVAIRRLESAVTAAAIGFAGGILLVLPFTSIHDYVQVLNNLSRVFGPESYNLVGLLTKAHATSRDAATAIAFAAALVVLAVAYRRRSLILALGATLVASPIVWNHYFVMLLVPLAISRPRLSGAWFIPLALWVCPGTASEVRLWHVVVGLLVLAAVTGDAEWGPLRLGRRSPEDHNLGIPVEHRGAG